MAPAQALFFQFMNMTYQCISRDIRMRFLAGAVLAVLMVPAAAEDLDHFRQLNTKAHQLLDAHDDAGARNTLLEAISALNTLGRGQDKDISALEANAYFDLATIDEKLGRDKDAEAEYGQAITFSIPLGAGKGGVVIDGALKRQQVLYLREGDYQSAANAAQHELDLYALLVGRNAPLTAGAANATLPPTLVLAKSNVHFGELKAAKVFYDRAWALAEAAVIPPPGSLQELYTGSVAVYSNLNLPKEAEEAQQRYERLKQAEAKQLAIRVVQAPPAPARDNRPDIGANVVPDVKAAFKLEAFDRCKPAYPRLSLNEGQEGTVGVRIKVSREGRFVAATISQSSGFLNLDRATMNAFSRCEFTPALVQGQPVDGEFESTYVWKLP